MTNINNYLFLCGVFLVGLIAAQLTYAQAYAQADKPSTKVDLVANLDAGKKIYELCATCHYANGWGKEDGSFPVIAGQHSSVIKKQLADFRARNRENPTMYPFTDNEILGGAQGIEDVTAYISQLPTNATSGKGNGEHLDQGKKHFVEKCAACHGTKGEGNAESVFPRIQGQHYAYTLRQLQWMRDGLRKNANPVMLAQIKELDDNTMGYIADYISRIEADESSKSANPKAVPKENVNEKEPDCD